MSVDQRPAHHPAPDPAQTQARIPSFSVISGRQVQAAFAGREREVVDLVEQTYLAHDDELTVNPPSYFLRFPEDPSSRIIALPASLGGDDPLAGLKWISSFPANVDAGIPRASAVLILNDAHTGYPFACLESSIISATRTAASAALAADRLSRGRTRPRTVGFFGTGLIARYIHTFLAATGWEFDAVNLYDSARASAQGFADYLSTVGETGEVRITERAEDLVRGSDLVVFATVAGEPHVHEVAWFDHHPLVLHVSLRDLDPEILLASHNVVDDVEHCLKANTSPHLVEQRTGNRDFLDGTLADVIRGRIELEPDRTVVFSPFGLGVLDLALGRDVHDTVRRSDELLVVDDFFHERSRHS